MTLVLIQSDFDKSKFASKFIWWVAICNLLPAATKLWPRLCFYSCLWFCPGGVCLSACWDTTPLGADTPSEQTHTPLIADTPSEQKPPSEQTPTPPQGRRSPGADTPLRADTSSLPEADSDIRSMRGRYASYWNAFLLLFEITQERQWCQLREFRKNSNAFLMISRLGLCLILEIVCYLIGWDR